MKTLLPDKINPPQSVGIMRVASVNNNITGLQQRKQGADHIVHRLSCRNKHHDLPWRLKLLNQGLQAVYSFYGCTIRSG